MASCNCPNRTPRNVRLQDCDQAYCCKCGGGGTPGPPGPPGPPGSGSLSDFSVNAAWARRTYPDGSACLSTGSRTNAAGAYVGGGTGNKSILGFFGYDDLPIGSLTDIAFVWENVVGPAGPNYLPAEPITSVTPMIDLIVDFDPLGVHDYRICILLSDQQAAPVSASLGTYVNVLNVLTYSWLGAVDAVSIVGTPPAASPGGVAPFVSVGPSFLDNSYLWSALVAANPDAVLVDVFPGDGGYPSGTIMPAVLLDSGDSANLTKSGKKINSLVINGVQIFGP